ncbi:NYN domain-containing protein [Curtanaerobium respiraculi]|uniref:NYN domain-containing protein n=1 Tax=Curtanaerobium respiraculi TaxID=2949669 RepID=UPI0024B373A0|nr:NYN domain-containing protein [Curtanaerobium respiraculi]
MKSRKKLLIVDGYNILRSGSRYRHLQQAEDFTYEVLNKVREALINDVIAYMGRDYARAYVVFDSGSNQESDGTEEVVGGVHVVFSGANRSADTAIEKLAHDGRERGWEVMVVTSDATIQDTVFGLGVDRMSADGFSREADLLDEEARQEQGPRIARKATVADRIPTDTLAKLKALRDGE